MDFPFPYTHTLPFPTYTFLLPSLKICHHTYPTIPPTPLQVPPPLPLTYYTLCPLFTYSTPLLHGYLLPAPAPCYALPALLFTLHTTLTPLHILCYIPSSISLSHAFCHLLPFSLLCFPSYVSFTPLKRNGKLMLVFWEGWGMVYETRQWWRQDFGL